MEIKASTAYNKKNHTEFASFNSLKGKRPRLKNTFRIVCSIIFYCIALFDIIFAFQDSNFLMGGLMCIVLVMLILSSYIFFVLPKISFKFVNPNISDIINEYTFSDDHFDVSSNSEKITGSSQIKYEALYMVYETDRFFYLYIDRATAYIVEKEKIESATTADLRNIIQPKLPPKKYILCRY